MHFLHRTNKSETTLYCNVAILSRLRLLSGLLLFWIYVQCQITIQNQHRAPRGPIAAPWRGAHRPPYLFLAMVIVMKVVGIDKIKLFRNFIFQKSTVIFTSYQHLRQLFFLILT
jgi:hypothetical protein